MASIGCLGATPPLGPPPVGLTPSTDFMGMSQNTVLMVGGGLILLLVLLKRKKKRKQKKSVTLSGTPKPRGKRYEKRITRSTAWIST